LKILVISDSHGFKDNIIQAISKESPDMILHIGDNKKDCDIITATYPEIPLRCVKGNCDRFTPGVEIDNFVLEDKRIMMTHGHLYGVKTGTEYLIKNALEKDVDILLYGHTHIPHYSVHEHMAVINPGSLSGAEKTYAVLEIKNGDVSCFLKEL